jgi:TfoX/Sxy family transcriptional regulator of competence genes
MKLIKPSAGLITEFKAVMAQLAPGEPRKMFGYDAFFVYGNMAVGLWQNTCVVKVSAADQAKLLQTGAAVPFAPMKGRVMTGWLELSEELAHDPEELLAWSERAVTYVSTLPPKLKKASKKKSTAKPLSAKKVATRKKPVNPDGTRQDSVGRHGPRGRTASRRRGRVGS